MNHPTTRNDLREFIAEHDALFNQAMDALNNLCDLAERCEGLDDEPPVNTFNTMASLALWAKAL